MTSRSRQRAEPVRGDLSTPADGDLRPYAVFTQLTRGEPHVLAGWLEAADAAMAMQFAREHYGKDQECVNIWVVPRDAISATSYDHDLMWRHTDQSYRLARGYSKAVRDKWMRFRDEKDVKAYEKEDLKQAF
jgi:ring-1,2-phenylacetyl-CoA epoxidase subunit PaaB